MNKSLMPEDLKPKRLMPELWGCLVLAQLPVQAGTRLRPHLSANPVVILEGARPTERVCSVNTRALALGLREGMTRVEVETFDNISILPKSSAEETAAQKALLEAMSRFSPRVEAQRCAADWECIVDLAGTERLMGTPHTIACQIVASLQELGFSAFCCIAANADAGLSVARFGAWSNGGQNEPSGGSQVRIMENGKEAWALSTLPVHVLRLEDEMHERFQLWGIRTLGELANLPETALITRVGQQGKTLRLRASGHLPHFLKPTQEEFRLEEVLQLEEPVDLLEPLLYLIETMLQLLLKRVTERAMALASVTVTFQLEVSADRVLELELPAPNKTLVILSAAKAPCIDSCTYTSAASKPKLEEFSRTIRPAIPTTDSTLLLKMLQLDLEAHPAPGAVTQIRLTAEPGATSRIQLGLFAPQMPEPTRFEDTHARLVSLVGEGNVGRVRLLDTHAAESFILERFTLPSAEYKLSPPRPEATPPSTALRRLRPALHVRVSMKGLQILGFWLDARRFEVVRCFGPWRSSGAWWAGNGWSADTWDLATRCEADGEILLCLLAHDLTRDAWLLEGVYD